MMDKVLYAIVGAVVGMLLFGILRPDGESYDYDRIIVHEIKGEPVVKTERTVVDRIVYRDREPDLVVTQPSGGEATVEDFCHPDTVVQVVDGDTVWVHADTVYLLRSVDTDAGWFWAKDRVRVFGPTSTGDLLSMQWRTWPGWSVRTDPDLIFREPRLGWIKPIVEYGSVATLFYFLGSWIGGE